MDATSTGPNYNWDYSRLVRNGQQLDTMLTTSATNPLLNFFFIDIPLNSNRANHAAKGQNFNLGLTGLSDVFNYYYNSSGSYSQPGFGAVVNSVPIPIAYSPHDVIYNFPLIYNDQDSTAFGYDVDLMSTVGLYYHVNRSRNNIVDGWGTLTTPFGTFDVLRVKTKLIEQDSVYIDTFQTGVKTPPVTTFEYKWLGKGFGFPLLQINTTSTNIVTQILYQDSLDLTAIGELPEFDVEPVVFPNPASGKIIIHYSLNNTEQVKVSLFSIDGKRSVIITDEKQNAGDNFKISDLTAYHLSPGNYLVRLEAGNSVFTKPLQIIN
jgi:hypothetical protein